MSNKVYDIVTDNVLKLMAKGVVPWKRPWSGVSRPCNAITGRPYSGGNLFLMAMLPYANPAYLTYKQAVAAGGTVKKGEKGWPVFMFTIMEKEDKATKKKVRIPIFRFYTVFNVEQTEGCKLPERVMGKEFDHDPIDAAHRIIENMPNPPKFVEGGSAHYRPSTDTYSVPHVSKFEKVEEYYCTHFHEMGHATGHESRLDRKELKDISFGSESYSLEELVAEMTAAFLCAESGIDDVTLENSAAYLAGWHKKLANDPKMFWTAASRAQKAADYILNRKAQATEAKAEETEAEAA